MATKWAGVFSLLMDCEHQLKLAVDRLARGIGSHRNVERAREKGYRPT
jgi:hypothetical protein